MRVRKTTHLRQHLRHGTEAAAAVPGGVPQVGGGEGRGAHLFGRHHRGVREGVHDGVGTRPVEAGVDVGEGVVVEGGVEAGEGAKVAVTQGEKGAGFGELVDVCVWKLGRLVQGWRGVCWGEGSRDGGTEGDCLMRRV